MKKAAIMLAVIGLLALASAAQAVVLQQGWYVKYGQIALYGSDGPNSWADTWYGTSTLGQYGPLSIQDGGTDFDQGRLITVQNNADVQPGVLFEDSGQCVSYYYSQVVIRWQTSYNPNILQLQMYKRSPGQPDQLLWKQIQPGQAHGWNSVWDIGGIWNLGEAICPSDQVVVRIVAVPEPSSLIHILLGITSTAMFYKKIK